MVKGILSRTKCTANYHFKIGPQCNLMVLPLVFVCVCTMIQPFICLKDNKMQDSNVIYHLPAAGVCVCVVVLFLYFRFQWAGIEFLCDCTPCLVYCLPPSACACVCMCVSFIWLFEKSFLLAILLVLPLLIVVCIWICMHSSCPLNC